jgi:hypothetical protein
VIRPAFIAVGVVLLAVCAAGVYAAFSGDDDGAATVLETATPSAEPSVQATTTAAPAAPPERVPVSTTPPEGVTCPERWLFFDNPVLHYTMCYPEGWGFVDYAASEAGLTSGPATMLPRVELSSPVLWGPDLFPLAPRFNFPEELRETTLNLINIKIEYLPADLDWQACQPTEPVTVGRVGGNMCEYTYDALPGPEFRLRPDGEWHNLIVLLPPAQPAWLPADVRVNAPDMEGWVLVIDARSKTNSWNEDSVLIWQMLNTIRLY